jgi:hypothetical protein
MQENFVIEKVDQMDQEFIPSEKYTNTYNTYDTFLEEFENKLKLSEITSE